MTHVYKRDGTITLLAALEIAISELMDQSMWRHLHQAWLKRLLPFRMHFTPTSASWTKMVSSFLIIEERCGVSKSVAKLQTTIEQYVEDQHADPKPFRCTASATKILERAAAFNSIWWVIKKIIQLGPGSC